MPGFLPLLCGRQDRVGWRSEVSVVRGLELLRRDAVERRVHASGVVPVDSPGGHPFDVLELLERPSPERRVVANRLSLEQTDRGLSERVVIGIAEGSDRGGDALERERLSEAHGRELRPRIAVVNQAVASGTPGPVTAPQGVPFVAADVLEPAPVYRRPCWAHPERQQQSSQRSLQRSCTRLERRGQRYRTGPVQRSGISEDCVSSPGIDASAWQAAP